MNDDAKLSLSNGKNGFSMHKSFRKSYLHLLTQICLLFLK